MSSTLIIIGITCVVSFLAFNNARLLEGMWFWPPALEKQGEYQRLLTYGLVHADFTHLLFNMITLYFFGTLVEKFYQARMGDYGFAFFYTLGLLVSILPTWWRHRHDAEYRSLGASGAVSAVLFAFILLQPWSLIYVFFVPLPAIVYGAMYVGYSIWMDRHGHDNVNHSAHLWGAGYGMLFTLLLEPRVGPAFVQGLLQPSFG